MKKFKTAVIGVIFVLCACCTVGCFGNKDNDENGTQKEDNSSTYDDDKTSGNKDDRTSSDKDNDGASSGVLEELGDDAETLVDDVLTDAQRMLD